MASQYLVTSYISSTKGQVPCPRTTLSTESLGWGGFGTHLPPAPYGNRNEVSTDHDSNPVPTATIALPDLVWSLGLPRRSQTSSSVCSRKPFLPPRMGQLTHRPEVPSWTQLPLPGVRPFSSSLPFPSNTCVPKVIQNQVESGSHHETEAAASAGSLLIT